MKSLVFIEVILVILGGVIAPLIAFGPLKENRPKAFGVLIVLIGLMMFAWDQSLMSNTGRGLSEHFNCTVFPDGVACEKTEAAAVAGAKPTVGAPAALSAELAEGKLSPADAFDKGEAAYNAKDFVKARALHKQACDGDDARGCYNLGFMWTHGEGGGIDKVLARALYKQACEGGYVKGCHNLGFMWDIGEGGGADKVLARALYKQACDGGYAGGCNNLGFMWDKGEGGGTDKALARSLYKQACDGGSANACENLSLIAP